jgi:hypothetical protein
MSDISNLEEQRDRIIEELEELNKKMATQNSIRHVFLRGLIYGVGVLIGSAVIATIILGVVSPWVVQIDWVQDNFTRGVQILRESSSDN